MNRKISTLLLSLCSVLSLRAGAALVLSAGDSFSIAFDDPAPVDEVFSFDIRARLIFSSLDLQEENDSFRLSLFEDSTSSTSFYSRVLNGSSRGPIPGFSYTFTDQSGTAPWRADRDGVIRVEMLSGSLALQAVEITIKGLDGNFYKQSYAVPEPSAASMLLMGLIGGLFVRTRLRGSGR